jgi:hypothetical protein
MFNLESHLIYWSIGIALGVPLIVVFLTEVLARMRRAGSPLTSAIVYLRALVPEVCRRVAKR